MSPRLRIVAAVSITAMVAAASALLIGQASHKVGKPVAEYNMANCQPPPSGPKLKAFATAEGFGQYARGGRGGRVYLVTNLDDAGQGSLRECAEASGPRTCVFRVSGTITVSDWIKVMDPYLTIAGQTSPGGIAIRIGRSMNSPMLIQTHDVIVRHLRLRPGPSQRSSDNVDTLQISGGAHEVILDHLSTSWPTDEGINIVGSGAVPHACGDTRNVTVQWSILSEGLNVANRGAHSRGTYFGYGARNVTFHHNLIASNVRRNPLVNMRDQFDMINNVIFNSARYNGEFYTRFGKLAINMIGNVAIVGPDSDKTSRLFLANYFRDFPAPFDIYLKGNMDVHRRTDAGDERLVLEPGDWQYVRATPVGPVSLPAGKITDPAQAYRDVAAFAGATKPGRDAADNRLIGDMRQCRGKIIDDPSQVGGWPVLAGPQPPADNDKDGIADAWEVAHGLSPNDPQDGAKIGPDGYTPLERYLGELAGDNVPQGSATGPAPDLTCGWPIATATLSSIVLKAQTTSTAPLKARLTWSGQNIKSCKLAGKGVAPQGFLDVAPAKQTTYEIDCIGVGGDDAIDSVTVG